VLYRKRNAAIRYTKILSVGMVQQVGIKRLNVLSDNHTELCHPELKLNVRPDNQKWDFILGMWVHRKYSAAVGGTRFRAARTEVFESVPVGRVGIFAVRAGYLHWRLLFSGFWPPCDLVRRLRHTCTNVNQIRVMAVLLVEQKEWKHLLVTLSR
jgi:hypothetical protein